MSEDDSVDLAYQAGRNASDAAKGKDILLRYRQLVAQKNAEKELPIRTKQQALATILAPAVSDGSSSEGSNDCTSDDDDTSADSPESNYTDYNQDLMYGHNLMGELDAEEEQKKKKKKKEHNQQQQSSSLSSLTSSGKGRGGGSDKENRTPSRSPSPAPCARGAAIPSKTNATATTAAAAVASGKRTNHVGGKKFFVSKKALALDGQWAMVGEGNGESGDDVSSGSSSKSDSSDLSSSGNGSSAGTASCSNAAASTNGANNGTACAGVQQEAGELLSTGVSFLEDASFLDSSIGQASLDLSWKGDNGTSNKMLSPVVEGAGDESAVAATGTPDADANGDLLSKSVYTFTPGSTAADCGAFSPMSNVTGGDLSVTAPSAGMFDAEWNNTKSVTDPGVEGGSATSPLKDASMWVLPPEQDSNDETLSNAPSDEVDESVAAASIGIGGRQVFAELPISPETTDDDEVADDASDDDENDERVASLTPNRCLRKNAIDQALDETTLYMSKIQDLESALQNAQRRADDEAEIRRECEKRVDELLGQGRSSAGAGAHLRSTNAATPLQMIDSNDLLNESAFVSPQDDSEQDISNESSELLDARAATASLMERNQTLVKEIRFADQTCVELSERNVVLQRDVVRLSESLEASEIEKKSLQEQLLESTKDTAKLTEREATYSQQISDQKRLHKAQLGTVETELASARLQISTLESALKESKEEKCGLVADVAAAKSKAAEYSEQSVTKAVVAQMATVETELSSARLQISTLESTLKESEEEKSLLVSDLAVTQAKVADVTTYHEKLYKKANEECDTWRVKCSELEAQVALFSESTRERDASKDVKTPQKPAESESSSLSRTPTSTVLAKTLQSQLERGNSVEDRACKAETTIVSLQMQLEASRAEAAEAREEANALRRQAKAVEYDEGSSSSLVPAHSFLQDAENDADTTDNIAQESVERKTEESKEMVTLRSQLHEALYDKKALLLEVSTYKTSVEELEMQLETQQVLANQASSTNYDQSRAKKAASNALNGIIGRFQHIQAEAERKVALQQEQIEDLCSKVHYLQAQLDFETDSENGDNATLCSAASFSNRIDDTPLKSSSDVAVLDTTDAVMNATFATDRTSEAEARLDRCEQGWATLGAKASPRDGKGAAHAQGPADNGNDTERLRADSVDAVRMEADNSILELERMNEALVEDKKSLSTQVQNLKAELLAARNEAADMLNHLEREKEELTLDKYRLQKELNDTTSALDIERRALETESSKREEYEQLARSSQDDQARKSEEIAWTKAALSKLQSENDRLRNTTNSSKIELQNSRSNLDIASKRISLLEGEQERLESELLSANAQIEAKGIEMRSLSSQCEEQGNAIEQYRALRLEDAKAVEDLREALQESTAQAEALKMSYVSCNDKLAQAMERRMGSEEEAQELRNDLASARDHSRSSRNALEKDLSSALHERDQVMKESERALASLQQEVTAAASSMRNVAASLGVREAYIEEKTSSMQTSSKVTTSSHFTFLLRPSAQDRGEPAAQATQNAVIRLRATIAAVREKLAERDTLIFDKEIENKRLSNEVAARSKAEEQVKSKLAESVSRETAIEAKLEKVNEELETHIAKLSLAEMALQQARESIAALENHVESTANDCKRIKEAQKEKEAQLRAQRDSAYAKLNEKENSLVDTLVRHREESSTALTALKERLSVAETERDGFSSKNESLNKKCTRLRDYVKSLTEKCEEWSESYRIQSDEVVSTKKENMELIQRVSQMRSLVEDGPNPSCTSCVQLRSVIAAQCQVRAALLNPSQS